MSQRFSSPALCRSVPVQLTYLHHPSADLLFRLNELPRKTPLIKLRLPGQSYSAIYKSLKFFLDPPGPWYSLEQSPSPNGSRKCSEKINSPVTQLLLLCGILRCSEMANRYFSPWLLRGSHAISTLRWGHSLLLAISDSFSLLQKWPLCGRKEPQMPWVFCTTSKRTWEHNPQQRRSN